MEQREREKSDYTQEEQLQAFRQEIGRIKDEEMAKKAEGRLDYNPHFKYINSQELGEREYEVYVMYKNDNLTVNHFNELRGNANKIYGDKPMPRSIEMFWAYLANKMQEVALKEFRVEK